MREQFIIHQAQEACRYSALAIIERDIHRREGRLCALLPFLFTCPVCL